MTLAIEYFRLDAAFRGVFGMGCMMGAFRWILWKRPVLLLVAIFEAQDLE